MRKIELNTNADDSKPTLDVSLIQLMFKEFSQELQLKKKESQDDDLQLTRQISNGSYQRQNSNLDMYDMGDDDSEENIYGAGRGMGGMGGMGGYGEGYNRRRFMNNDSQSAHRQRQRQSTENIFITDFAKALRIVKRTHEWLCTETFKYKHPTEGVVEANFQIKIKLWDEFIKKYHKQLAYLHKEKTRVRLEDLDFLFQMDTN